MKFLNKVSYRAIIALLLSLSLYVVLSAQQAPPASQPIKTPKQMPLPQKPDFSKMEIQTLKVQGNVYLLGGAGSDIAVQTGDDGILIVDTGLEQMATKTLAAIRKLSDSRSARLSIRLSPMTIREPMRRSSKLDSSTRQDRVLAGVLTKRI